jgi:hypothetical protein
MDVCGALILINQASSRAASANLFEKDSKFVFGNLYTIKHLNYYYILTT